MSKITAIRLEARDGSVHFLDDREGIEKLLLAISGVKVVWKKTPTIDTLRRKYFAMLQELHQEAKTGYTKNDLHEHIKPLLLGKFKDFAHYFKTFKPENSTQNLNVEGWSALIDQLRSVANDVFNYTFKN